MSKMFPSDEIIVIAMAKLLDSPAATRLDSHIERVRYYAAFGIVPAVSAGLDRRALVYANARRRMEDRDLIGQTEEVSC